MNSIKTFFIRLYCKLVFCCKNKKLKIESMTVIADDVFLFNNSFVVHKHHLNGFDINSIKQFKENFKYLMITNNDKDITHYFEGFIKVSREVSLTFQNVFDIFEIVPGKIELFDSNLNKEELLDYNKVAI